MTRLSITLLICALYSAAFAQPNPDTLWTAYFGSMDAAETGWSMAALPDSGYVVVGSSWGMNPRHTYFLRIRADGSIVMQRTFGVGGETDFGVDVYPLPDQSGLIICGRVTDAPEAPGADVYITKTSMFGTPQWIRFIGDDDRDESVMALTPTDDGGYFLLGWAVMDESNIRGSYLAKVNSSGNLQWTRDYNSANCEALWRAKPLGNDTYIVLGATSVGGPNGHDIFLNKVNGSGDTLWTRTYGGPGYDEGHEILVLPDGGFLVAGMTTVDENWDMYLVRTDMNGDTLWTKAIGDTAYNIAWSIVPGPAGGFVMVGSTPVYGGEPWEEDLHIVGTDANGNEIWRQTYHHTANNYLDRILKTPENGYIVLANFISPTSNDIYIIKTGPDTGVGADEPHLVLPNQLALGVYPNPFNSRTRISFSLPQAGTVGIDLFNLVGQKVMTFTGMNYTPGEHSIMLSSSNLASGTYFIQLNAGGFMQTKKIVLLK